MSKDGLDPVIHAAARLRTMVTSRVCAFSRARSASSSA
jgi:hypothetical protein